MKKKVIIVVISFIILLIIGLSVLSFYQFNLSKNKRNEIIKENDIVEINHTDKVDLNNIKEEDEIISKEEDKEDKQIEQNKNTNDEVVNHKQNQDNNVSSEHKQNNIVKDSKNEKQEISKEDIKPNEEENSDTSKKEIWEELGMSEYHYYNEPMYAWERIDFSIERYGTKNKTVEACLNYANNYEPYLNGIESYDCSDVLSTSGKYLGQMFTTTKLE